MYNRYIYRDMPNKKVNFKKSIHEQCWDQQINTDELLWEDSNTVIKNISYIWLLTIVLETARKYYLHVNWVPFFVLDSEPLITTWTYGIASFISFIMFILYWTLHQVIQKKFFNKEILWVLIIIRLAFPTAVGLIISSYFIASYLIHPNLPTDGQVIYYSKDFFIKNYDDYSEVSLTSDKKPYNYCKKDALFKDICSLKKD